MGKNIWKQFHLPWSQKTNKYLGVNLTKNVNDLYKENYNPLRKRLRRTTEGRKVSCAHGLVEST
jgi:hypothetical protein